MATVISTLKLDHEVSKTCREAKSETKLLSVRLDGKHSSGRINASLILDSGVPIAGTLQHRP